MLIPVLGVGIVGRSVNLSAIRRLNLYLEIDEAGDKSKISAHALPGLTLFRDFGDTPIRGMLGVGELLYLVHRGTFWEVNNAAIATNRGTLTSTAGRVSLESNGVEIFIADGLTKGWVYNLSTFAFTAVTDVDATISNTVTFLNGTFIANETNTGRFRFSDVLAGLNWASTAFATAESNPDNLVAVISERGLLMLFGEFTTESWANTGASPVPYAPIQGATQEWGLAARFSLSKFDQSLIFLGRNRIGQISIMRMDGVNIVRVSPPDLDHILNGYTIFSDASGFSYMLNGHPMYQINFPAVMASWLYDGRTGQWSAVESSSSRHRAEISAQQLGRIRVSDYENGKLYTLDPAALTDNGAAIARELRSGHIYAADFDGLDMSELRLDMETGIGIATGQGSDPRIALSISRDGGHTYGIERWKSAGKIGKYRQTVRWRRLTLTRDTVFLVRITDPVRPIFLGAALLAEKVRA